MNDHLQNLAELESEFAEERRGEGSLSPFIARDVANFSKSSLGDGEGYLGYDIHPEDLEALYFEGLKMPRWESIEANNIDEQKEIYMKSLAECTAGYPLISRVTDTDQRIKYTPEETQSLQRECESVLDGTDHAKAIRALQKFYIACDKAASNQMGLVLTPS
jgi:hypothetical protein